MTQNNQQNKLNVNSYAKFLSKGIILVKDCWVYLIFNLNILLICIVLFFSQGIFIESKW